MGEKIQYNLTSRKRNYSCQIYFTTRSHTAWIRRNGTTNLASTSQLSPLPYNQQANENLGSTNQQPEQGVVPATSNLRDRSELKKPAKLYDYVIDIEKGGM